MTVLVDVVFVVGAVGVAMNIEVRKSNNLGEYAIALHFHYILDELL